MRRHDREVVSSNQEPDLDLTFPREVADFGGAGQDGEGMAGVGGVRGGVGGGHTGNAAEGAAKAHVAPDEGGRRPRGIAPEAVGAIGRGNRVGEGGVRVEEDWGFAEDHLASH